MADETNCHSSGIPAARTISWCGRSGRHYALIEENPETFVLKGDDIYIVTSCSTADWIGSAEDIVDDQASRSRFRAAMTGAVSVLRMPAPSNAVEHDKLLWDLQGGEVASPLPLAS